MALKKLATRKPVECCPLLTSVSDPPAKGCRRRDRSVELSLTLAVSDAIPALLGLSNGIVLKPDSPDRAHRVVGGPLLREAGLPEGLFQIVVGPRNHHRPRHRRQRRLP